MKTFVIADIASAHDGVLPYALDAINMAADAGANAVKFQFWSDANRLADRRGVSDTYRDIYKHYRVPVSWIDKLKAHADLAGIEFMCTVFLPEDVSTIEPFVQRFKVSAFEGASASLFEAVNLWRGDRPLIVSVSGDRISNTFGWPGRKPNDVSLYCVSAYPAPIDQLNLAAITRLSQLTPNVGFSDHSGNMIAGALAVGAGARVIEAHLAHPHTNRDNPDAGPFAHKPVSFKKYVEFIRLAERMVGDGALVAQACEADMHRYRVTK